MTQPDIKWAWTPPASLKKLRMYEVLMVALGENASECFNGENYVTITSSGVRPAGMAFQFCESIERAVAMFNDQIEAFSNGKTSLFFRRPPEIMVNESENYTIWCRVAAQ